MWFESFKYFHYFICLSENKKGLNFFMKKVLFKGVGTAIATPFDSNGVNLSAFEKLLDFQLSNFVDGIIVCGTTGEASTMSDDEKASVIRCAVDFVDGKVPIIAGCGSNDTKKAIYNAKMAESLGVDGLLVVTPYYNKCTQLGLIKHFSKIAESVPVPIILYNVPSRTGVNIEPETCLELSKVPNIVAIKEASGNISQVAKIAALCKDDLFIYSGNDDQILPILSLGGIGVISVLSNIKPLETHNMIHSFLNGNFSASKNLQLDLLPLISALFCEVNPIPVKYALNVLGFDFGTPRLPLSELSSKNKLILDELLNL